MTDPVRDLMVMTVPGLEQDGQVPLVGPDEYMEDDGEAASFVREFRYDDIETMSVTDEVYDLMRLAVPSIGMFEDSRVDCRFIELPDDGMEATWDDSIFEVEVTVPVLSIAAPAQVMLLSGPAPAMLLSEPVGVPALKASEALMICAPGTVECEETVTETIATTAPAEAVADDEKPLVTFFFGPQRTEGNGWAVCFSF